MDKGVKDKNSQNVKKIKGKKIMDKIEPGITNVLLAENDIFTKKLEYIKDLCDETQNDICNGRKITMPELSQVLYNIRQVCINKTCNNCKYWQQEDITKGMVCVNADSDDCTCWTDANYTCEHFTNIEKK